MWTKPSLTRATTRTGSFPSTTTTVVIARGKGGMEMSLLTMRGGGKQGSGRILLRRRIWRCSGSWIPRS